MPTFELDDYYYGYYMTCVACAGTGINPENENSDCDDCEGDGIIYFNSLTDCDKQHILMNPYEIPYATCPKCKGEGCFPISSEEECPLCDGNGLIELENALEWINEHGTKNKYSAGGLKMSEIKMFRINGWDSVAGKENIEFYFKIADDSDGKIMFNLVVGGDGIYYYPRKSQILSPEENENTRENYKMISMPNLQKIFEALKECKWFGKGEDVDFDITVRKGVLHLSKAIDDEDEKNDQA